jgi:hypothetical protein
MGSSLPLALRCFTQRASARAARCASTEWCTLKTYLAAGEIVPIGWIAVGNPAHVLPPGEHERIWHVQKPLDFPLTVYGIERDEATMGKITHRLSEVLRSHASDEVEMYRPS